MIAEFKEHLKSQHLSQDIVDNYIQAVQDYITWLSSKGKEPNRIREEYIDETISYTIFEGTDNIRM